MEITIGAVEAAAGIITILILGPITQVITLRIGFNGLRKDVKTLVQKMTAIEKWIAVREDREKNE